MAPYARGLVAAAGRGRYLRGNAGQVGARAEGGAVAGHDAGPGLVRLFQVPPRGREGAERVQVEGVAAALPLDRDHQHAGRRLRGRDHPGSSGADVDTGDASPYLYILSKSRRRPGSRGSMRAVDVLAFSHIGVVVESVDRFRASWGALLGLDDWLVRDVGQPAGRVQLHGEPVDQPTRSRVAFTKFPGTSLELTEPVEGESRAAQWLRTPPPASPP